MHEAYRSRGNYDVVFTDTMNKICTDVKLASVQSCLAIGPGEGKYEIGFLKRCAENVRKFVAVEPDHDSAEDLRSSLRTSMPGVVESQVTETDLQSWEGPSDPVDLILMFHVLYFLRAGERQELFKKLHDHWLTSFGFVAIVTASRTKSPGNTHMIFERLGTPSPAWEDVEADLHKAGFTKYYAHEMRLKRDFANPDESLLRFYQSNVEGPISLDDVRNAIKELYPEGQTDKGFNMIAVFKRAN